ncbi:MAG TPA: DNA-processing protein DprA [Candidatus Megaira endosymbiont of Hartmannula sinica]|nr:DNA-processing protein DprA [Candidatus Megaera endosymbiont of Hartmannula sinica]
MFNNIRNVLNYPKRFNKNQKFNNIQEESNSIENTSNDFSYTKEDLDILRLIRTENIGTKTFMRLLRMFKTASEAILHVKDFSLRGGNKKDLCIYSQEDAEKEMLSIKNFGANFLTYKSSNYPYMLKNIDIPPIFLTYKGNLNLLDNDKIISIVGARNASINTMSFIYNISKSLSEEGYTIVSGLARGIDAQAHKASYSKSCGVIPGGINIIYPNENKEVYNNLAIKGLILSEFPFNQPITPYMFSSRNRIIAALSQQIIIAEASFSSGTMKTAQYALDYGRDVFVVPSFPLDPRSKGGNKLIKEGAYLFDEVEDIINHRNHITNNIISPKYRIKSPENKYFTDQFNEDEELSILLNNQHKLQISDHQRQTVLEHLSYTPCSYDRLLEELDISKHSLDIICLELELAGKIIRVSNDQIVLVN